VPDLAIRALIAIASIAMTRYQWGSTVVKDSERLMRPVRPAPFHLRWLVPLLCRDRVWAWTLISYSCLIVATCLFPGDLWAAGLFVCLPWFRVMAQCPVLTDAPALALSLAAMRLPSKIAFSDRWAALAITVLGSGVSERFPVWASLYGWRLDVLYAGLTMVAVAWKWVKSAKREGPPPFLVGWSRAWRWNNATVLVLPWGAGLAALFDPSWSLRELLIVAVAYGQMLAVFNELRMYMWAAPIVLPKAVAVLPPQLRIPALVFTWFAPWQNPKQRGEVWC